MASDKTLFIGAIDFGTTYSGYAFSSIRNKEQVYTYNWIESIGQSPKTPTSILFTPKKDFDSFGYEAEEKYVRISLRGQKRRWYFFKRFMMSFNTNPNLNESTTIQDFTGKEMAALDILSNSIKYFMEHLFEHFHEEAPQLRKDTIRWVMTVPVKWDEAARQFMRKAIEKAGIPDNQVSFALEAECAALYCQLRESRSGLYTLKPSEKFLLLDCGGGTLGGTVREVHQDNSSREIYRVPGDPWGSAFKVDDAFQEYLLDVFGFENILSLPKNDVIELENNFELLKRRVDHKTKLYGIKIPKNLQHVANRDNMLADRLILDGDVVKGFFKKPTQGICEKIREALLYRNSSGLKTVILVGGLSENHLLKEEIKQHFLSMDIISPCEPVSAVLKGAVEYGHISTKIRFQMSTCTYGVESAVEFKYGIHPHSRLLEMEGTAYCDNVLDIHFRKEKNIDRDTGKSSTDLAQSYPEQHYFRNSSTSTVDEAENGIISRFNIQIPNTCNRLDKSVNVTVIVSGTEIKVDARDQYSKQLYESSFKFE